MTQNHSEEKEMSFLDHLEELRWHLIKATGAVVVFATIAFILKQFIFDGILFWPEKSDFPTYRFLCKSAQTIGLDNFCFSEFPFDLQSRTMAGQFSAHIWTSITAGFIVGFPFVLYEFWKFVSPGLHRNERKSARGFIFIASLLFFIGVLFGYFVVTPLSINFLGNYKVSELVLNEFDLSSYIGLVRACALSGGVIFELPIIMYFLTKIGLVTPEFLKKYRKFALVIVLIISAIITPPDIASQVIVTIPVIILYEISIVISRIVIRNQEKKIKKRG